jgi:tetratricopeptide (TPR) repeat protein
MKRFLCFAFIAVGLSACVEVSVPNPCYNAWNLIGNATGAEIVEAANRCLADDGDRYEALTIRGAGYLTAENTKSAIDDLNAAIKINPNYATAWFYRGMAYKFVKDFERATADLNEALRLGLPPEQAMMALCRVKFWEHQFMEAYRECDKLLAVDPNNEEALRARGGLAHILERFDQADADFSRAITLNPDDFYSYSGRAYVRYFQSRYAEAAEDYKRALRDTPDGLRAAFLYLAMRRAGDKDAVAELARQEARVDTATNPGVFPAFLLGHVGQDDMLDIGIRTGIHTDAENRAESYFYAAMDELLKGNSGAARLWFEKVLGTGVIYFDEVRGARKELRAMGIHVPSPDPESPPDLRKAAGQAF